jgi:hypothetical protein
MDKKTAIGLGAGAVVIGVTVFALTRKPSGAEENPDDGGGDDGGGGENPETQLATLTGHVTSYLETWLLPGVTIEIGGTSVLTAGTVSRRSGEPKYPDGTYTITDIPVGTYTVNVSRAENSPWGQGPYGPVSQSITLKPGVNVWNFAMGNTLLHIPSVAMEGYEIVMGTPRYQIGTWLTGHFAVTDYTQPYPYYSPGTIRERLNGWLADGDKSYYTYHVSGVYEYDGVQYPYSYDYPDAQWRIEDPIYWRYS